VDITLRILFDTAFRKDLMCINLYDHLADEMAKIAEVKMWGPRRPDYVDEPLDVTINRLYGDDSPDWVIANCFMHLEKRRWVPYQIPPPEERSWKIATFTSDIHANGMLGVGTRGYLDALNDKGFDAILMLYSQLGYGKSPYRAIDPDYFLKNLKPKVFHCPPWINPDNFRPVKKRKRHDVVFLGMVESMQYPLRLKISSGLPTVARRNGWRALIKGPPPGSLFDTTIGEKISQGHIAGRVYNETLSRSKVFIFGSSIYRYPLLKYVEGWGAGTLVMADKPLGAERMHLEPDVNFVEVGRHNWGQKLKHYIDDDDLRASIAKRGHETVMKYHTASVRAKELLSFLRGA